MAKKIITIFFLAVFLTQLLPLREVGQFIAGATMTEELPESASSKSTAGFDTKWLLFSGNHNDYNALNNSGQFSYIHYSETLPSRLLIDVKSPPPNFFC